MTGIFGETLEPNRILISTPNNSTSYSPAHTLKLKIVIRTVPDKIFIEPVNNLDLRPVPLIILHLLSQSLLFLPLNTFHSYFPNLTRGCHPYCILYFALIFKPVPETSTSAYRPSSMLYSVRYFASLFRSRSVNINRRLCLWKSYIYLL